MDKQTPAQPEALADKIPFQPALINIPIYLRWHGESDYNIGASQLPQFWRLHKGYLVNPDFVKGSVGSVKYQGVLQLTTGGSLPVPDGRKEQVYALLRLQEAARPEVKTLGFVAANFALRCSR